MSKPRLTPDALKAFDASVFARAQERLRTLEELAKLGRTIRDSIRDDGSAKAAESRAKLSREIELTEALRAKLARNIPAGEMAKCEHELRKQGRRSPNDVPKPCWVCDLIRLHSASSD
jgi:hypothetical protein